MTYRERKEAKIEKRLDWAQGRRDKAAALRTYTDRYHGDVAFNTQPGHIPERARVIGMIDRACEHVSMAATHESKAAGIQDQLDHSIYSDDEDAVGKIRERIAGLEAKRDRMKLVNSLFKKGDAAGLAAIGLDLGSIKAKLAAAGAYWGDKPHLPYELTNLGGNIRRLQERIKGIEAAAHRKTMAEAAPGGTLIEGEAWVRVTFAEKPERVIIEALKAVGFRWGGGHWIGERAKLPHGIGESPAAEDTEIGEKDAMREMGDERDPEDAP